MLLIFYNTLLYVWRIFYSNFGIFLLMGMCYIFVYVLFDVTLKNEV